MLLINSEVKGYNLVDRCDQINGDQIKLGLGQEIFPQLEVNEGMI